MRNKILILIGAILLVIIASACDSYLETELYDRTESDNAFKSVSDIEAAQNGLYYQLGSYRLCGNYILSIGDFASDISVASGSSGHFVRINTYAIGEYEGELADMWEWGYKIINTSTKMLAAIETLSQDETLSDSDKNQLKLFKAEGYAIRAMSYFHLVNVFGLPYGTDLSPHGGLVLMDDVAILPEQNVSRSSVTQTYTQIHEDIARSLAAYEDYGANGRGQFYLNKAAVNALNARVYLYEKEYYNAQLAAEKALEIHGKNEMNEEAYLNMWKSLVAGDEEIFTIAKTEDDNLSANSINTLYGSYDASVSGSLVAEFEPTDYRLKLINLDDLHPKKFDGIEASDATSNIPQFRVSEMHLIIAEAYLLQENLNIAKAKEHLLVTAKRNTAIKDVADLPGTKDLLIKFIAKERKRELFQEGHRWYDVRRTGELIDVVQVTNWDASKFVYPIPAGEINSGYQCEQNENWHTNLPK